MEFKLKIRCCKNIIVESQCETIFEKTFINVKYGYFNVQQGSKWWLRATVCQRLCCFFVSGTWKGYLGIQEIVFVN